MDVVFLILPFPSHPPLVPLTLGIGQRENQVAEARDPQWADLGPNSLGFESCPMSFSSPTETHEQGHLQG